MSHFTEIIGLDEDDVSSLGSVYSGYAEALSRQELENQLSVIASSWLIGGIFQSLTEPKSSAESFSKAAYVFLRIGSPLWLLCAICSTTPSRFRDVSEEIVNKSSIEEDEFYKRLLRADLKTEGIDTEKNYPEQRYLSDFTGYIPELNIPYRLVLSAISELEQLEEYDRSNLKNFFLLLGRLGEFIESQEGSYHWQHLEGAVLPFEPVALTIAIVLMKIWLSRLSSNDLEKVFRETDNRQTVLLQIANELIGKGND